MITAEREVKIFSKFNSQFTKDESQNQFILKTLLDFKNIYPTHNREMLRKPYNLHMVFNQS